MVKRCFKKIKSINTSRDKLFKIKVNSEVIRILLTKSAFGEGDL